MPASTDLNLGLAGLDLALAPANEWEKPRLDEVEDDLDGEQEALNSTPLPTTAELRLAEIQETLAGASKGVTEKTDSEYHGQMNKCVEFLRSQNLIEKSDPFFSNAPSDKAPSLITAWIMDSCDEIKLNGIKRPATDSRSTYTHAQKMRAAMTYAFGRLHGLGSLPWHKCSITGRMLGNPSVSEAVSSYMVSLRRRKVHSGETQTSARAITPTILETLYDYNNHPENSTIKDYTPGSRKKELHQWGGARARLLLQSAYTLAFLCLLRVDEVLKIQIHHLDISPDGTEVKLTLPFRKTHQFGEAHLCPVRALAEWLKASRIDSGYLFRHIASGDRVTEKDAPMTSEHFLELFRNNLLDIGIDHYPYGTHSFRRGGCQYLASYRRWSLRLICEWGGWSMEFTHLTIVKYLISWNDEPQLRREDFFNPDLPPVKSCFQCGRSCRCA